MNEFGLEYFYKHLPEDFTIEIIKFLKEFEEATAEVAKWKKK